MTTIGDLAKTHEELYGRYLKNSAEILEDPAGFARLAEELVSQMEEASAGVTEAQDYEWLRSAADKWRNVFASFLKVPREIELAVPREALQRAPKEGVMIWSDRDLEIWVRNRAYELAKERAVRRFQTLPLSEMLRRIPSTEEESRSDWETANTHLASEILEGKIGLGQIRPASYHRLENSWLDDVRRLKAYFIWLDKGGEWDAEGALENYREACAQVQQLLLRPDVKRPASEFEPVCAYMQERGLTGPALNEASRRDLVARKAKRIWQGVGGESQRNWLMAEEYVSAFYDNIIAAVWEGDAEAALRVLKAVDVVTQTGWHLASNTFEAAIVATFVNAGEAQAAEAQAASAGA